jgi:hypothetical protein
MMEQSRLRRILLWPLAGAQRSAGVLIGSIDDRRLAYPFRRSVTFTFLIWVHRGLLDESRPIPDYFNRRTERRRDACSPVDQVAGLDLGREPVRVSRASDRR